MLLGVETNDEGWDIDDLLADAESLRKVRRFSKCIMKVANGPDVPLSDQDTGMVDALGQSNFKHLCLEPAFQEIFDLEGKHVIETHAALIEHTNAHETANEGVTLKETLGVFDIELEELTGSTTNFGQGEGDTPDLALVTQTVFSSELIVPKVKKKDLERFDDRHDTFSSASRRADSKGRRGTL